MKIIARIAVGLVLVLGVTSLGRTSIVAQNAVISTALAEAQLASMPAAPVNVRISEASFEPGATALTHSHGGGWVYVVQGAHVLTMAGRTETFLPGQAVWTPAGVAHTHDWDRTQIHKFWFIGTATNQPPTLPPGFRLFRLTDPLEGLLSGPYTVRLSRIVLQPGAQAAVVKVVQPEVLIGLLGTTAVVRSTGANTLRAEEVQLMQAGSAYMLRNQSAIPSSILVQTIIARE